jgi:hypothetical protein
MRDFPLLPEEGWPRQQIKWCEATFDGADGVVIYHKNNLLELDHHLFIAARCRACIRSAHARLRG